MNINEQFKIEKVTTEKQFEGLKALWSEVFGDPEEYVDAFFKAFDEIEGYVIIDTEAFADSKDATGKVVSALTLYKCGTYKTQTEEEISDSEISPAQDQAQTQTEKALPVYVSYAVCTDPDYRGAGLASELVCYVRDIVNEAGGISLVSPAEPSLIEFYEALGYVPHFMASESVAFADALMGEADFDDDDEFDLYGEDDFEAFDPGLSVMNCDTSVYNMYREAFLTDVPHIELSDKMLELIKADSKNGDGLYIINGGDAVCTVTETENNKPFITELIVNPMLMEYSFEIESEIASRLAKHFGIERIEYRSSGYGTCQSMIAASDDVVQSLLTKSDRELADDEDEIGGMMSQIPPYFGFPLD